MVVRVLRVVVVRVVVVRVVVVRVVAALRERVAVLEGRRDLDGVLRRDLGVVVAVVVRARRAAVVERLVAPALHIAEHERDPFATRASDAIARRGSRAEGRAPRALASARAR